MSAIPTLSRTIVKDRENVRCCRCGTPSPLGEWHHRRSRRVVDVHQHCPCNGVWLCRTCHVWVHANPMHARRTGFIVSMHNSEPENVPVFTPWGTRFHDCHGNTEYEEQT